MTLTEHQLLLREGRKITAALGKALAPLVEVVLHDLTQADHAIVAIANNLSGRQIGDPATEIGMARAQDPDFPDVLQNYPNHFPDGRPAKSTSIGLRDSRGEFVAALCLNMDISMLNGVVANLCELVRTQENATPHQESLAPRGNDIRSLLEKFAAAQNTIPRALTRTQRQQAMQMLAKQGLLDRKNAPSLIADIFGVARSTVYTYLPDTKANP
ncbi:helix-turn-helix transcriptional regulator [Methylovirgula sp. 4M-Z18]|uniref:helix-turn-helix transcriptional regulator n=1 Tax=Methylovirgula sp. 4M-Z18 TaxID=2293567 RepID=UPI000E2FDF58|nr:PAS domain-containing protein [Methylovirgula sp. 4M-Z18]RFB81178.1 transcriptional regulator [Methylovirgula sp. 4M-Z18]